MNEELTALEARVEQLANYCSRLRTENQDLRTKVANLEGERRTLTEKMDVARSRLEVLMTQLPSDEEAT